MGNNAVVGGLSIIVLLAVVGTIAISSHSRNGASRAQPDDQNGTLSTTQKNIQEFCRPTDYPQTCQSSLYSTVGNKTERKDLVDLTFKVTIEQIQKAFNQSKVLSKAAKDPRTSEALENCRELLDYAIGDLRTSVEKLDDFSVEKIDQFIDDLKVWLSASITYQETCLDGFASTTGDAGASMRKALSTSAQLTSNILAIVTNFEETLSSLEVGFSRKLLADVDAAAGDYPSWFTPAKRRLLSQPTAEIKPNVVVAQDGSGNVKTIAEALLLVKKNSSDTFIIYIKEGVYKEHVEVNKSLTNVMMIGDGPNKTKITGSLNFIDGTPTFKTATVAVLGDGFIGKDLWIENTAGPEKHQAVALRVQSDRSVFYNMRMDGYQDTLYAHTKRQYYRECTISGTVDFIFGDSPCILQNCMILARKPMVNQQNIVTAQGRKDRRQPSAIIIHNCTIAADPAYFPHRTKQPTFLGRPWKEFSRTFILQSQIDDLIDPKGWLPWYLDFGLRTCFYTEFDNRGPGANKSQRVAWQGIKTIDYAQAQKFTVERFIQGNSWLPKTGVPYIPGLLPPTTRSAVAN